MRRVAGTSATTGKSSSLSPFHMVMLAMKIAVMIAVMTAFSDVVLTETVRKLNLFFLLSPFKHLGTSYFFISVTSPANAHLSYDPSAWSSGNSYDPCAIGVRKLLS